jgi:HlyD family secretion protein
MMTRQTWSVRAPLSIGFVVLAVVIGGLGLWSALSTVSGAVIVQGQLEVDTNRQVVQHLDGGVVEEVFVREGDRVTADQVLIRLDDTILRSQLTIVESQLFEVLARRGRLEAERDGTAVTFPALLRDVALRDAGALSLMRGQERLTEARRTSVATEVKQLRKRGEQIGNQIEGLTAQQTALVEQIALIDGELADQQTLLQRGLAQASRVSALRREHAMMRGALGDLRAQEAEAEGRRTEIDIKLVQLRTRRREEAITQLRDLQYREMEMMAQRRALLNQLERLDIAAPVAGTVYGMQVFGTRSVLKPGDPLLYLVPKGRPLVVATRVEPIHIDQLRIDQPVDLQMSAFDPRITPRLSGRVAHISADAFSDQSSGRRYYRVEIILSDEERARLPPDLPMIPGMPVEAYIRTRDRTPLSYLLQPLAGYFAQAFRES